MNTAFDQIITASDNDRGALFVETAARLGTAVQNVEKDFWVCWTLDARAREWSRIARAGVRPRADQRPGWPARLARFQPPRPFRRLTTQGCRLL